MKLKTIKSLKAEREVLINKLSNTESKEAKEFINYEIEVLDYKIEGRIITKYTLINLGLFTLSFVMADRYINKEKK